MGKGVPFMEREGKKHHATWHGKAAKQEDIAPLERFGEERVTYKLSSVGVWIIVSEEGSPKYYMAVQQADEPGLPWGIPAGKVSDVDQGFRSVGMREVQEETGMELNRDELRYLHWGWKHDGAETGNQNGEIT